MPNYEIKGKGKDSGRKRTRIYSATNEDAARQLAEIDGTTVEELVELPPDLPTERQLDYAKDLGIAIPVDATKGDVSDLISMYLDEDKSATERHREFAKRFGIEVSRYIGKRDLFDRIQADLIAVGRERELLSWFTYRVYRELVSGADDAPIGGPDDPVIQEIAGQLESDEAVIKSVRRYTGRELIWFGEWTSPDGFVQTGGSNRTAAYKRASSLLRDKAGIPTRSSGIAGVKENSPQRSIGGKQIAKEPKGCLSVIALALILPLGFVAGIAWLGEFIA
jgi:hypothetical protein